MELGFSPTINNTFTGYQHVSTFANLPIASSYTNQYFIVDNPSGVWLINRKEAGFYKSDGTNWNYVGSSVDMTSLSDGTTSITASPIVLQGTNGITATSDTGNNKIIISGAALPQISSGTTAPSSTPSKIGNDYINTNGVFYKSKGNSSASDWVKLNGSYILTTHTGGSFNPADSTTYYWGSPLGTNSMATWAYSARRFVPRAGTISTIYGLYYCGVGTNETSSLYLRINDTTDYLITSSINNSSSAYYFNNTSLSIYVNQGDYFVFKWITPTWATNPTSLQANADVRIDL